MINELKIKDSIKKNGLYVPRAFMYMTLKYKTPSKIIEYEPIMHNKQLIGWALMWDVEHHEYQTVFTTKKIEIRLIGVFVKEEYRNFSLATFAMNKLLQDHKKSKCYDDKKSIYHCNTWTGFSELLHIHGYQEEIIESVYMKLF